MSIDDQIIRDPNLKPRKKKSGGAGLNSNAVKLGLAGVLLLLLLVVFGWQLGWFGGGDQPVKPPAVAAGPSGGGTAPPLGAGAAPPPPPAGANPAADTPPPTNSGDAPPVSPTESGPAAAPPGVALPGGPPSMPPGNPYGVGPGGPAETPPLPQNVAEWNREHYLRARQEGNPLLIEAVTYLGDIDKYKVEKTAVGLADLLKPLKPPENTAGQPAPFNPGGYGPAQPELIKAIIFALDKNGSKYAKQKIVEIIQGKFPTDDERTAVEAALQVMIARQSVPEFQSALLQLIAQPEAFRPQGAVASAFPPAELQRQALEMLKPQANAEFRKKLAQQLAPTELAANQQLSELLLQEDAQNLDAQLTLYRNEEISKELHAQLEQYFVNYASTALGQLLGIASVESEAGSVPGTPAPFTPPSPSFTPPPNPYARGGGLSSRSSASASSGVPVRQGGPIHPGGAAPSPYVAPPIGPLTSAPVKLSGMEQAVQMAKQIWAGPLADSLTRQLDDLPKFEKEPNAILLASTIPTDPFRAALFKLFKKRVFDGPQALDAAGLADRVVADPGLLVLVKLLPIQRKNWQALRGGQAGGPGGYYPPQNPYGSSGAVDPRQKREQAEQDWYNLSLKLLYSWRARLDAQAQAQKKAARKKDDLGEPAPDKCDDLDWPKDFKLLTACQLNWPEHAPKGLTPVMPGQLKIRFFRLETEGQIKKSVLVLNKGQRGSKIHNLESGVWLDIVKSDPERNLKRSVDIVITHADNSPYDPSIRKEENADLQIDVLTIEISDPAGPKEPPPEKSKQPGNEAKPKDEGKVLREG